MPEDADLVIIGGGGSGLAAAVRAREMGVEKVVVLEKTARPGGNAWLAVVMLGLGDGVSVDGDLTAWHDETFANMMQFGKWTLDPKVIHAFLDTYPRVVRWLTAKGLELDTSGFDIGGRKFSTLRLNERRGDYRVSDPARGPGFLGSTVGELLLEECRKLGVEVLTKTRVTKILLDPSGGKVAGVSVTGPRDQYSIAAPTVILAAGGFGANEELMRKYFPEHFREEGPINTLCLGSSTGDAIALSENLDLAVGEDMDPGIIGPGHHPWHHSIHEALLRPESLWVNKNGERFTNESLAVMAGPVLLKQPGSVLFALLDSSAKDFIMANPNPRQIAMGGRDWLLTLDEDLEAESLWKRKVVAIAGSWDELAGKAGIEAHVLAATVDRYNALCDQAHDADFAKAPQFLMPLRTPPYYAMLGVRFCHGTAGGVRVNERMEVSTRAGVCVKGLYATGDNTSGWVTEWGLPGTTLAFSFTSGYIAAQSAATQTDQRQ